MYQELEIPDRLSDNVTLSTMHGCPPDEIQSICNYLMQERRLHTYVKCNPTLLGPERVRSILNDDLDYRDVIVPDCGIRTRPQVRGCHTPVEQSTRNGPGLRPRVRRKAE